MKDEPFWDHCNKYTSKWCYNMQSVTFYWILNVALAQATYVLMLEQSKIML